MSDLQQYLDQALSQIKLSDTDEESYLEEYDIEVELRELIISTCKGLGTTQKQPARRSEISQTNIGKIEDGDYHPGAVILKQITDGPGKRLVTDSIDFEEGL